MRFLRYLEEAKIVGFVDLPKPDVQNITQSDINHLEVILDKVFKTIGIDIEFTRHFLDRVNNKRNKRDITIGELRSIFLKEYKKYSKILSNLPVNTQAVLQDIQTDINIPFVLQHDPKNGLMDLVTKTVMRKKGFKTPNKTYKV